MPIAGEISHLTSLILSAPKAQNIFRNFIPSKKYGRFSGGLCIWSPGIPPGAGWQGQGGSGAGRRLPAEQRGSEISASSRGVLPRGREGGDLLIRGQASLEEVSYLGGTALGAKAKAGEHCEKHQGSSYHSEREERSESSEPEEQPQPGGQEHSDHDDRSYHEEPSLSENRMREIAREVFEDMVE